MTNRSKIAHFASTASLNINNKCSLLVGGNTH